ncbi:eukaryotic translation initiation factor 2 subunit 2 isoform X4 [Monomorium pharaonis]|uniref:eukaryotic translation initiation factor 2 subunit 2 isoform X4 n=1 Tax=Monomorium pharaonis TaxID=307658 RepID=UPI001746246B|nr:eukaryotic translation initiation factor 2 subunit 2 isoform X4 [Monomorium pharaonis]
MTEEDSVFDPTLKKKKKKKKTTFDIEAAFNEGGNSGDISENIVDKENQEPEPTVDDDEALDLENFGKKKKKKKKAFNLDELEAALPDTKKEESIEQQVEEIVMDDDFDLDMDFSKTKKKKKKKKDLDELVAEEERKEIEDKENVQSMICKTLHRQPKHLLDFLLAELGTSGSVDGNSQLIIKGRFQQKQIENVLRRYIKEYVTCHTCRSPDTILQKDTRLFFLQCETCGSRCSVASIKSGFQAVTGKRAAIRAKTA